MYSTTESELRPRAISIGGWRSESPTPRSFSPLSQVETRDSGPGSWFDNFRRANNPSPESFNTTTGVYNERRAAVRTTRTALARNLKSRHLQFLAIGGSIGTGLWIGSGNVLVTGGPGSTLIAYTILGVVLYCTMQAMGEMASLFPIAGSFAAFGTRFIDPAWGFAMGWNYAVNWLIILPLEIIAALHILEYWKASLPLSQPVLVTVLLVSVFSINLCGVRAFGEAEFVASVVKAAAVIGFILLGIIINIMGDQNTSYIGGRYWVEAGIFHNGFKGFCSVLVTISFAFAGTEVVGLAAAETKNPTKAIPTAVRQVFWRIFTFYILSVLMVSLIVRSDDSRLTGSKDDPATSPFVIAIKDAGIAGLDSVMNAVILISVLSVANSSFFGSSRVLAALAEQKQAPSILGYVDRKGRPIVAVAIAAAVGLLAYMGTGLPSDTTLKWLTAISGLSSNFTWASICFAHIRLRKAWDAKGYPLDKLVYRSPVGVWGSWVGFTTLVIILVAQFWVAIDPIDDSSLGGESRASAFFSVYLAAPVVLCCFVFFKLVYKTKWVAIDKIDLDTGRYRVRIEHKQGEKSAWRRLRAFLF